MKVFIKIAKYGTLAIIIIIAYFSYLEHTKKKTESDLDSCYVQANNQFSLKTSNSKQEDQPEDMGAFLAVSMDSCMSKKGHPFEGGKHMEFCSGNPRVAECYEK